jgi:hypothetical protein
MNKRASKLLYLLFFVQTNDIWSVAMNQSLLRNMAPWRLTKNPLLRRYIVPAENLLSFVPHQHDVKSSRNLSSLNSIAWSQTDESNSKSVLDHTLIQREPLQYSDIIDNIFRKNDDFQKKVKVNQYWLEPLKRLNRHKARVLVSQLNPSCPLGFDPLANASLNITSDDNGTDATPTATTSKRGSLLAYVREQKVRYPECILLIRVGEFYEAYGIDAILLVEHCGLNPM